MLTRQRAQTVVDMMTRTMYIQREIGEETDLCYQQCATAVPIKAEITDDSGGCDGVKCLSDKAYTRELQRKATADNGTSTDAVSQDADCVVVKQEVTDEDCLSSDGEYQGQENIPLQENILLEKKQNKQTAVPCSQEGNPTFVCKLCKAGFPEFQSLFGHLETHRRFSAVSWLWDVCKPRSVKKNVPCFSTVATSRCSVAGSQSTYSSSASLNSNISVQSHSTSDITTEAPATSNLNTGITQPCDRRTMLSSRSSQLTQVGDRFCKNIFQCRRNDKLLGDSHLDEQTTIRKKKVFTCEKCSRSFGRKNHYKRHMTIHAKPQTFQCSQCNERFKRRSQFDRHRCIRPYGCQMWKTHGW